MEVSVEFAYFMMACPGGRAVFLRIEDRKKQTERTGAPAFGGISGTSGGAFVVDGAGTVYNVRVGRLSSLRLKNYSVILLMLPGITAYVKMI